jgi:hypothetical protein
MRFVGDRLFSDPEVAARKLVEIANAPCELVAHRTTIAQGSSAPSRRAGFGSTRAALM